MFFYDFFFLILPDFVDLPDFRQLQPVRDVIPGNFHDMRVTTQAVFFSQM